MALIFVQHFKAFKNIEKWQIFQSETGKIEFRIIKGKNDSVSGELEVNAKILSVSDVGITFKYVDFIELTKRVKHLFLIKENSS
jgi:hypothetical protein